MVVPGTGLGELFFYFCQALVRARDVKDASTGSGSGWSVPGSGDEVHSVAAWLLYPSDGSRWVCNRFSGEAEQSCQQECAEDGQDVEEFVEKACCLLDAGLGPQGLGLELRPGKDETPSGIEDGRNACIGTAHQPAVLLQGS